jgi:ADP-heptose:LPS heptosyltransferase
LDYNLGLLAPLGINDASPKLRLELPPSAHDRARQFLHTHKIDPPSPNASPARTYGAAGNEFVVFHPGSARAEKFWEPERWAEVIKRARQKWGVSALITGGKWSFEQQHIESIKSRLADGIVDLSGRTDLPTLAALIAKARLLVTVDSAAMHLAAALGTPQVALFGPTNPFHWRPRESPALILHGESRVPISEFSPKQERLPMKQISTQAVFDAMDALLSAPAAQHS